jgi:hypothetical protein
MVRQFAIDELPMSQIEHPRDEAGTGAVGSGEAAAAAMNRSRSEFWPKIHPVMTARKIASANMPLRSTEPSDAAGLLCILSS